MRNLNCLVTGQTGSGKGVLAKVLITLAARTVILDPEAEYGDIPNAFVTGDFEEACRYFLEHRREPFVLDFQYVDREDAMRLCELLDHTQEVEIHGPLVIVVEEASEHSTTQALDPILHRLYIRGRHRNISMLTVIQLDTDIHRTVAHCSPLVVSCYQEKLSGPMAARFKREDLVNLHSMQVYGYVPLPVQGEHFLVSPRGIELYDVWGEAQGYVLEPEPDKA